jgi:uncharacterized Zn finger protein
VREGSPGRTPTGLSRPAADSRGDHERRQVSHYDEAVTWLAKARDAHLAAGREKEWRAYLEELITRHRRKYKLRPMLEDLE